ncbi:hypothetical protein KR51_00018560 [Rubidibacter lacunae KORDI 51-2]|uniref:Uncharacterized protein n=1 Tax=Rubidibacter lacunae KORDI 51-2 TaxID=582515 RepID=U5DM29_9CHRO|nr:hypothetical protein [Rubidibacter lacunae]ERN41629.1 hypothetical protein KR51_00018560 [Rubidibacter lacunae KORDI 51-2]
MTSRVFQPLARHNPSIFLSSYIGKTEFRLAGFVGTVTPEKFCSVAKPPDSPPGTNTPKMVAMRGSNLAWFSDSEGSIAVKNPDREPAGHDARSCPPACC